MPQFRHLCQIIVCATLAAPLATAHTEFPTPSLPAVPSPIAPEMNQLESPSYLDQLWSLSIFRFFKPSLVSDPTIAAIEMGYGIDSEAVQGCPVEALQEVEDAEALQFEQHSGGFGAVNIDGLTPSTSLALARFQRAVVNAGGAIAITSAYRPAAYQEHLRNVWEKWMVELRYNTDPLCQGLRAEVRDEFSRHSLLESQRPVVMSDHTRGLSFDAAVQLPRSKKSRLTVDLLASRAGVRRPDIARDPVHFRLAF